MAQKKTSTNETAKPSTAPATTAPATAATADESQVPGHTVGSRIISPHTLKLGLVSIQEEKELRAAAVAKQ